ncbi:serine kinase [Xanthomonas cerealis pv. cerealis]|uniref:Serine kinase n=1 Tax=Xanthomonas cerealis pv. cerealis TaxID=152263 RepID=A0A514EIQ6_9XANT|nr:serine kinase [Xanthomonas translucens]QDI05811.1 serine kinase [Xanthomonas translucens pv. cerealis]UKE67853.1 serine kinase [Xanthomonas translucens pv. pistacia]
MPLSTVRTQRWAPMASSDATYAGVAADPFHERLRRDHVLGKQLLGCRFQFESNSEALLQLVEAAFGGVPAHQLPDAAELRIELNLIARNDAPYVLALEPPPVRTHAGAGALCGVIDADNYMVLTPEQGRALLVVSEDMLAHPYHVRYELIEFAVFVLAARAMRLVPLHGACVGAGGRGVLLLGASGSGKSTLALHSLLRGLQFLAEDALFVEPQRMLATGIGNFLHLRPDLLRLVDAPTRAWIAAAPTIRRRSGVSKHEVDIRNGRACLAPAPLQLAAAVFVSGTAAADPQQLLRPIAEHELLERLSADQPYAAAQPGWSLFVRQLQRLGVYELQRGAYPDASVDALLQLLP